MIAAIVVSLIVGIIVFIIIGIGVIMAEKEYEEERKKWNQIYSKKSNAKEIK